MVRGGGVGEREVVLSGHDGTGPWSGTRDEERRGHASTRCKVHHKVNCAPGRALAVIAANVELRRRQ